MDYRTLGKDLKVSAVGMGCMGLSRSYGERPDRKYSVDLIAQAVDMGYTFFDTAPLYGTEDAPHDNEELLGEALKPYRDKIVLATKCGVEFDWSEPSTNKRVLTDARPDVIKKSLEDSLKRLQTDHIDLYYLHRVDPKIPIEEVAATMKELYQEGKILHWGLSAVDEATIRKAHAVFPLTAIENRYSMMYRSTEDLFPTLEELNIDLVAYSPLANGLLTNAYTKADLKNFARGDDNRSVMPQFTEEGMDKNKGLLALIQKIAEEKQATPGQISLAWMIDKKPWIVPIPGSKKASRLKENLGARDVELSQDEVKAIDDALDHMEMSDVFGGAPVNK